MRTECLVTRDHETYCARSAPRLLQERTRGYAMKDVVRLEVLRTPPYRRSTPCGYFDSFVSHFRNTSQGLAEVLWHLLTSHGGNPGECTSRTVAIRNTSIDYVIGTSI